MRVKIGKYKNRWIGPYQIARTILFWLDKDNETVDKFGDYLNSIKWLVKLCEKIYDFRSERNIKVKIDPWDTYSLDYTLAHIILPALKELQKDKTGVPNVDNEDVPEELYTEDPYLIGEHNDETWARHEARWQYVLGEIIFAFESKFDDWSSRFHSGGELDFLPIEGSENYTLGDKDPSNPHVFDIEGHKKYQARISNGFRLFGKYYENFWT